MFIGIDIRLLTAPYRTGVAEYTIGLLNTIFDQNKTDQFFLFYNSWKDCSQNVPMWEQVNVEYVVTRFPNKLLSASLAVFKRPRLDKFIANKDKNTPASQSVARPPLGSGSGAPVNSAGRENTKTQKAPFLDYFLSPNLNFTSVSRNTKHILIIHDLSFEFFPDCYTYKQRLWHRAVQPRQQCQRADLILTPSENTKRDVVEYYGIQEEKVKVVYPGLMSDFRFPLGLSSGRRQNSDVKQRVKQKYNLPEKFILFIGTIEPRKNIVGILEAYKHFCSIAPLLHFSLIIAGPKGWKCDDIFAAMDATLGCRYIGYVAPEDKPALYQLASVFVYPSLYEGFGFPVLEAMAAGTPVVTSSRSSLPEVVGTAGYLVNPLNVSEIAEGMTALVKDQALRELLIGRGFEQAKKFNWRNTELDGCFGL